MIHIRLGTRGSALARWQAEHTADLLRAVDPALTIELIILSSLGDRVPDAPLRAIAGKGAFTSDIEAALLDGRIDAAVHSLKDLPTRGDPALTIAAIPQRGRVADALIARSGAPLADLPPGAVIGTSSTRRAAQVLAARPDLVIAPIRGNVDTRIAKALSSDGTYDGVILAAAGLDRLGRLDVVTEMLSIELMLPAPGQGALAVQCRADDADLITLLARIDHRETRAAVSAERGFLAGLGTGCSLPVAAFATFIEGDFYFDGRVFSPDGSRVIRVGAPASARIMANIPAIAAAVGESQAQYALTLGAADLIAAYPSSVSSIEPETD